MLPSYLFFPSSLLWISSLVLLSDIRSEAAIDGHSEDHTKVYWSEDPVKEIKSCLSPDLEDEERKTCRFFAAVIDAGSTGTRLHLFEFSHDPAQSHSPFKVESEVFKEVKPGLSAFATEPENAAMSVRGLISAAREIVPSTLWTHTPVVMKATAGLRLLPDEQADGILRQVEAEVQKSGLLMDSEAVGILSGTDEGVYGWFTLNFLVDRLQYIKQDAKKTAVALDLGGGSTQITFVPEDPRRVFSRHSPEEEFGHSLSVFGNKIRLYTHSYLGNGLVASRMGIGHLLPRGVQNQLSTHCFPAEYTLRGWEYAGDVWTIKSTPEAGFEKCLESTREYVAKMGVRKVEEVAERDIYAFAYFYDRAEQAELLEGARGVGKWIRVGDFAAAARRVCALKATEIGAEHWRPWQCLDLTYIYSLLTDGYGLAETQLIHPTKKLRSYECSWALGAGYHLLNTYHDRFKALMPESDCERPPKAENRTMDNQTATYIAQIYDYLSGKATEILTAFRLIS